MEVVTLGLGAAAAYISKDGVEKLLGPTADYLGKSLAEFTQRRAENIGKIFRAASLKLGTKIETAGEVPPKVLKAVLDDGSFSNDPLAIEYLGGILASSRTETGRDDRGARLAKVVDSMSTYQLRAHYLIYASVRKLFLGKGLSMGYEDRPKMQIFIPFMSFMKDMDFSPEELPRAASIIPHIFFGLTRDMLIEEQVFWGDKEHIKKLYHDATDDGITCIPSAFGVELFLSVFGYQDQEASFIFDNALSVKLENVPYGFEEALATRL